MLTPLSTHRMSVTDTSLASKTALNSRTHLVWFQDEDSDDSVASEKRGTVSRWGEGVEDGVLAAVDALNRCEQRLHDKRLLLSSRVYIHICICLHVRMYLCVCVCNIHT